MEACLFCKIIKKEIPATMVYENDDFIVFLDIRPVREGHLLVVPKKHEPYFYNLDEKTYHYTFELARKMALVLNTTFKPIRVGLVVAGLDVPHTHVHVIPMFEYHDISSKRIMEKTHDNPTPQDLKKTAEKIKANL